MVVFIKINHKTYAEVLKGEESCKIVFIAGRILYKGEEETAVTERLKLSLFALFYNFILLVVYIILTPYLIYKSKSKKYKIAIPAKFFLKNNPKFEKSGVRFHSCSMGEVRAIKPSYKRV